MMVDAGHRVRYIALIGSTNDDAGDDEMSKLDKNWMVQWEADAALKGMEAWFEDTLRQLENAKRDIESYREQARKETDLAEKANRVEWAANLLQQQARNLENATRVTRKLEKAAMGQWMLDSSND